MDENNDDDLSNAEISERSEYVSLERIYLENIRLFFSTQR